MHRGPARPFVIVDDGPEIIQAANRALERLGRRRTPILIREHSVAQQFLSEGFRNGSIPAAVILRVHEQDDPALVLLDWIRNQPAPLCFAQVLVIIDAEIDECEETLAVWMENAFRHLLHLSERAVAEELSATGEKCATLDVNS